MASSSAVPAAQKQSAHIVASWTESLASFAARIDALGSSFGVPTIRNLVERFDTMGRALLEIASGFAAADEQPGVSAVSTLLADTTIAEKLRLSAEVLMTAFARRAGPASLREARAIVGSTDRRFLRLQLGDDGRVVEVLGDFAHARHVAVVVPGMSNDLSTYESDLRRRATDLLAEMARVSGSSDVAVVAWLGYNTPDGSVPGLIEAARSTTARSGATTLRADLATLHRLRPSAHLTVVAHSYGSVVLGAAMRSGVGIDDAVVVGSPGMDVDDRHDLGSPRVRLWAAHSAAKVVRVPFPFPGPILLPPDLVAWAPAHGEDPAAEGFGARRFATDGVGHSSYFDRGSKSLRNIARIATGRSPS